MSVLTNAVFRRMQGNAQLSKHQQCDGNVTRVYDSANHEPRLAPSFRSNNLGDKC